MTTDPAQRADEGRLGDTDTADAELSAWVRRAAQPTRSTPTMSALHRRAAGDRQLLSPEAQGECVLAYQKGLQLAEELRSGKVSRRHVRQYEADIKKSQRYLEDVVATNFRLVQTICRELATKRNPSRDRLAEILPELTQEAHAAMVEAAQKFDPSYGVVFPKYAARAMRDRVRAVLSRDTPIAMSPSMTRVHRMARHEIPELAARLGRRPTTEEIQTQLMVRCMDWAEAKLTPEEQALPDAEKKQAKIDRLRKQGMIGAVARIEQVLQLGQQLASLDAPVGGGEGSTLGEMVADNSDDSLFDHAERNELADAIHTALQSFPERERQIILYRYGFIDGESWTFGKISEQFGVTPERIRQIDRAMMAKLRLPGDGYDLGSFLDID